MDMVQQEMQSGAESERDIALRESWDAYWLIPSLLQLIANQVHGRKGLKRARKGNIAGIAFELHMKECLECQKMLQSAINVLRQKFPALAEQDKNS